MGTTKTIKLWTHKIHENVVKTVHMTGFLLHRGDFWAIMAILALVSLLLVLIIYYSGNAEIREYVNPLPFGTYYH